jgi:hypothetical protein
VVEQSVVTPRAGGSLLTQVLDQNGAAVSGVRVDVAGADQNTGSVRRFGITDSAGCTIFGSLLVGDYNVTGTKTGYVDYNGVAGATPNPSPITTTAGNTATPQLTMGQAGKIIANFQTTTSFGTYANQQAPALSWNNNLMSTPGLLIPGSPATSITTAQTLFPFNTTTPSGSYTAWGGKCITDLPTTNQSIASVLPGATVSLTGASAVKLPALIVKVLYKSSGGATAVRQKPDHVKLTDSCGSSWQAPLAAAAIPSPDNGALSLPGQPYGTYPLVCADYVGYKATAASVANTNFTTGTTVTLTVTNGVNAGIC